MQFGGQTLPQIIDNIAIGSWVIGAPSYALIGSIGLSELVWVACGGYKFIKFIHSQIKFTIFEMQSECSLQLHSDE